MKQGAPLLVGHDAADQVGVIENFEISGEKKLRVLARFSRSARAEEIWQDVLDGIRRNTSVGYMIHDLVLERQEGDVNTYRVTDWEPYEGSLVSIPADPTVGVGRQLELEHEEIEMDKDDVIDTGVQAPQQKAAVEPTVNEAAIVAREQKRVADITAAGDEFAHLGGHELARELLKTPGATVEQFRAQMLNKLKTAQTPTRTAEPYGQGARIELPRRSGTLRAFTANSVHGMKPEEAAYRAGQWARAVLFGDQVAERWCRDYGVRVMTGQTSGTSVVVPDEMILPIIDLREQYGIARQKCYVHPMSSDTASVPRRKSGVTAYFVGRTESTTASDSAFDEVNLVAREVAALTRLSNSYAADSSIDLADHLANEMAYAFAVKEDDCLFNGDGTSTYGGIYGIRPKLIDGKHTAGAIDAASGNDLFTEITNNDLVSVVGALPEYPGIMPEWYVSKRGRALMFDRLAAAAGGNTKKDMAAPAQKEWMGDAITISQSMPSTTGDLSNVCMAIYGDLRMGVTFGDRQGFEIQVLRERYAEFRQIGIQAVERFDIAVHGLGDTTNAGPIVGLIGE